MPQYTQQHRPLGVNTPLGKDVLLLTGFEGSEGLSQLFYFDLDLVAEKSTEIVLDKLLGQPVTISLELPEDQSVRYISGICKRATQRHQDSDFTAYHLVVVPQVWLLTKRFQSRIFQHMTIPDILRAIFKGFDVVYEIFGDFQPRDYCVQYQESDFAFASRLMEEEGIYYFFKHTDEGHKMVLANLPASHPSLPTSPAIRFDPVVGGDRDDDRIMTWNKSQELRSGKVTLWDHCFELPDHNLAVEKPLADSVAAGRESHKARVGINNSLEIYEYPGGFAGRFDGVDRGGGDQAADLNKIFRDNERTAAIRIQQEAVPGLVVDATSNCRHLVSGYKFNLENHAKANGAYLITTIYHTAKNVDYRSSANQDFVYHNAFTCIPYAVPFRPARITPRPFVRGSQTAYVVGPAGEEIFTDKYGRVKVQFHWDRQGKSNADSSCWIRVSTTWADRGFGFIQIPRIGQEVIVDFLEGDPDQPIITGCVYNAKNMPPLNLPESKMISGFKSNSYPGGGGFNQITMDDTKGKERMFINSQYNQDAVVGNNRTSKVGVDSAEEVGNNVTEKVGVNKTVDVGTDETNTIGANQTNTIGANQMTTVGANIMINAGTSITLKCGASCIHMNQAGIITITGTLVTMAGAIMTNVLGPITNIAGMLVTSTGVVNVTSGAALNQQLGGIANIDGGVTNVRGGTTNVKGGTVNINC